MKNRWLNNTKRIHTITDYIKPCLELGFCPYGALIEVFPLHPEHEGKDLNKLAMEGKLDTGYSCKTFGHDCPVFYLAENITE